MTYTISPLPHVKSRESVKSVMWGTVAALIPVSIAAVYLFGFPAIKVILATVIAAVVTEIIIYKAASQPITIGDGNAVLIGLLLALLMPPSVPIWVPIIGAVFAIAVAKYIFGGTGTLIFHPALIGFAFLLAAWPTLMGAQSTPNLSSFSDLLIETGAGRLVEASPALVLLGGAFVLYKRYVDRRVAISATILLLLLMPIFGMGWQLPIVLTGGYFLGTDLPCGRPDHITGDKERQARLRDCAGTADTDPAPF
ncbi:MAG: RnfABCDGE type electron transport complex subunit D [Methanosarcinales archaeon]|nr:RnfABCDGE type electron transport complex subunit D [Methanosarcinales archaeon]